MGRLPCGEIVSLAKRASEAAAAQAPFPSTSEETISVPMSAKQQDIHDFILKKVPFWVRWKVKHGLPPNKREARQLNAFMSGARQVSNSTRGFHKFGKPQHPKVEAAFKQMTKQLAENPRAKGIVYSSFIGSGIDPYRAKLLEHGIPHGEYSGRMAKSERDKLVQDYNKGKKRVLLLSRAGAEGLDTKGTRLIQILEPHWNQENTKQVVGRGVRFMSHAHLPPEERHVHIQKFLTSRRPKGILQNLGVTNPGLSTDEYVSSMAHQKEHLNRQFRGLLSDQPKG